MAEERAHRRLAAILAADVVGYSRLMERDEAGTLAALKVRRTNVLQPLIAKYRGRMVKVMGDGVLVEFASAVNAVSCAMDLQEAMAVANRDSPPDLQIVLRVGINLGDVLAEGGDLYGDGINVAARLEGLADPGRVLVSETVFKHVHSKVPFSFENLGEQNLKNLAEPVVVYRVMAKNGVAEIATGQEKPPSKPAIVVLPFSNMSGDSEQEYFSDGITEDIITELSRFRSLLVIARNSSFQYRDKAADMRRIARELGVQYIVEGSLRKAGPRLRITAQLVEAATGNHLWAEHYDRSLDDIFAVQDEVVQCIVARLEGRLAATVAERARQKPTPLLAAYDCVLQARAHLNNHGAAAAEPLLLRATELDPGYAQAYSWLAHACVIKFFFDSRFAFLDEGVEYGRKAVMLDESDGLCHSHLAGALLFKRQFEQAGAHLERALALNPSDVLIVANHCHWLSRIGRVDDALKGLDEILLRDPFPPGWIWEVRMIAEMQAKRYEDTIKTIRRIPEWFPWQHAYLAGCYARLQKPDEAGACTAETLRIMPGFSIKWLLQQEPFKNPADVEHLVESLRNAGLPE